jgi:hypothetical protein
LARSIAAYEGCISGALLIDDYRTQLAEAGFTAVQVVDTGKDLNAYAKIENQAGCCSPAMDQPATAAAPDRETPATAGGTSGLPLVADDAGCCATGPSAAASASTPGMLSELAALIQRYDLNQFAASVQVFALKPAAH